MENLYLILLVISALVAIISIIIFVFLKNDEKNIKEVDNKYLLSLGKEYTKKEFEDRLFNQYINIKQAVINDDYMFLKDAVADNIYNQILLSTKEYKEKNINRNILNIEKGFSKLINFKIINNKEVIQLWIQYSDIEYETTSQEEYDENDEKIIREVITSGDKNNKVFHEYILTYVKNRMNNEKIICQNCGSINNLLLSSKCPICDNTLISKENHWVLVNKESTNLSKK